MHAFRLWIELTHPEYIHIADYEQRCDEIEATLKEKRPTMFIDNQAVISITESRNPTKGLKHLEVRITYLLDLIEFGFIQVAYVPSNGNRADIFTKIVQVDGLRRQQELNSLREDTNGSVGIS